MFINIGLSAQNNDSYFNLIYATSQGWYGGEEGSVNGCNYNFCIKFNKNADISFDSLWIEDTYLPFYCESKNSLQPISVKKGDSIMISAEFYYPRKADVILKDVEERVKIPNPCKECKSSSVIIFRVKGKVYFYDVGKIEKLPKLKYP